MKSKLMIAAALALSLSPAMATKNPPEFGPLTVTATSKVVVMEFEPWFGPDAIPFTVNGNTVRPRALDIYTNNLLSSQVMQNLGGGYASDDTAVIREQAKLIQHIGADALLVDLTNYVGCIFNADFCPVPPGTCLPSDPPAVCQAKEQAARLHTYNTGSAALKRNVTTLYQQLNQLNAHRLNRLKIIPLIGGQAEYDFTPAPTCSGPGCYTGMGILAATDFFLALQTQYPNVTVNYQGHPLMVYFHGAPQGLRGTGAWWERAEAALASYTNRITYRHMGGLFDDQAHNRVTQSAVSAILQGGTHPDTGFWTFIDRYNTEYSYYPSYNPVPFGSGVEAFTAAFAAPGRGCGSWREAKLDEKGNCIITVPDTPAADDTLAGNGAAFGRYMDQARDALQPTFLFVMQWNEYVADQGFDADTRNDMEPSTLVGFDNFNLVRDEIRTYKQQLGVPYTPDGDIVGYIQGLIPDGQGHYTVHGWACADHDNKPVNVHLYAVLNGNYQFLTAVKSDLPSVPAVATACKSDGANYRFEIPLNFGHGGARIHIFGISPTDSGNNPLGQSGVYTIPGGADAPDDSKDK